MAGRIRITTTLDKWVVAAGKFSSLMEEVSGRELEKAAQATYEASQDEVHIITGSLKGSGRWEVERGRVRTTVRVIYGGPSSGPISPVDYAIYEQARGGAHDFMGPAVDRTQSMYPESMLRAIALAIRGAFG
jgi:hypothetical protein